MRVWGVLLVAGCSAGTSTPAGDAAVDAAGDFAVVDATVDATLDAPLDLVAPAFACTTAACAAAPCTPLCKFKLASECPPELPSKVDKAKAEACPRFCKPAHFALDAPDDWTFAHGGFCWHYDPSQPGECQKPHCGWSVACEVHSVTFDDGEAAVCPAGDTCFDGRQPADAAAFCPDLLPPIPG